MNNADMPAMPSNDRYKKTVDGLVSDGLTKREHFAGLAMQGMLSATDEGDCRMHESGVFTGHLSRNAVEFADALLKELEK